MSGHAHGYIWAGKPALDKPSRADVESAVAAGLLATGEAIEMFRDRAAGRRHIAKPGDHAEL
ncbi:hypothetical protein ACFTSF_07180 [Kribbella sp. NPDC056951]|uniref:hypothetical protein n=1 Tax=Kribbella sp. NPDC056951 TaxID=3345978 RepID=UPI0036378CF9